MWASLEVGWGRQVMILREVYGLSPGGVHCAGPQEPGQKLGPAISVPPSPLQPPVTFSGIHLHHPHLSQSKDWKIDESVYEAHNVASKTRHSAEQLGASNGILFMSFSSRHWSHYRPGWCSVTLHSPSDIPMSC